MATSYLSGKKFFLKMTIDEVEYTAVCKTSSSITFTNTSTEVRNQCTGDYSVRLPGGQKSGSIDFSGAVNMTPTLSEMSGFEFAENVGELGTATWGGIEDGQKIVVVPVQINNVAMTADDEPEITFSATLDFAGTPIFSIVTT